MNESKKKEESAGEQADLFSFLIGLTIIAAGVIIWNSQFPDDIETKIISEPDDIFESNIYE